MAQFDPELQGHMMPGGDGAYGEYVNVEAWRTVDEQGREIDNPFFDPGRKVLFVNGMGNSPKDHVVSALRLSLVQMCTVGGIYNRSSGFFGDLVQCVFDKNQFDGPLSLPARPGIAITRLISGKTSVEAARQALARNAAQVTLFDKLRETGNRGCQIVAHSQGNLIVSNALQAVAAVDGPQAIAGRTVHTYGSPASNWPAGITRVDHGFTFDGVTWLAGFDWNFSISKVGMPADSKNPFTHGFLEYMKLDPQFVVNRFRTGTQKYTVNMDEAGLAQALVDMGTNMRRVHAVFKLLASTYRGDADDVAVLYVQAIQTQPHILTALRAEPELVELLKSVLGTGVVFRDEQRAIDFLAQLTRGSGRHPGF